MKGLCRGVLIAVCLTLLAHGTAAAAFKGAADLEAGRAVNSSDSLDAALGSRSRADQDLKLRLMWSAELPSGWSLDVAYLAEATHGGDVALGRRRRETYPAVSIDPQKTEFLRLDQRLADHGRFLLDQRLDCLAVGYSGTHLVVRAGRQALTWGGGLVFHPLDLFNPFPPNATYTTYKPGTDMLYGQWLFESGADLQAVVVPRRDPLTGKIAADQSSAGIKWHGFAGASQQLGLDLLLAKDYRSQVLGIAASGPAGGATWTAEIIPTRLEGGALRTSALANTQYAWSWGGKNINGYLEYFRNGFGAGGSGRTLATLPEPLLERLARGELFSVSKNELAAGADVQWTPLLTLKPSLIASLDDGSVLLVGQSVSSLSQNTDLTLGFQFPLGGHGSEYGGLPTAPDSGIYWTPAARLYARLSWYF
jgi:hypothetical protein